MSCGSHSPSGNLLLASLLDLSPYEVRLRSSRTICEQMNMVGHDYISKQEKATRLSCFVEGLASDNLEGVSFENRQSIFRDSSNKQSLRVSAELKCGSHDFLGRSPEVKLDFSEGHRPSAHRAAKPRLLINFFPESLPPPHVLWCAQLRDVPRSRLRLHTIRGRDHRTKLWARPIPLPPLQRPAS